LAFGSYSTRFWLFSQNELYKLNPTLGRGSGAYTIQLILRVG
jgi:hypothetical protein